MSPPTNPASTSGTGRPAIFLDRDGTIVDDPPPGYLKVPARVELIAGAGHAVARFNAAGWPVILVTNQAGISRGFVTEDEYRAVAARIEELLAASGGRLDATYICPHAPERDGPCLCRKPGPLLFERAAREHGLALAGSWFVGDRLSDVRPAVSLRGQGLLVETGEGRSHRAAAESNGFPVVRDIGAAADRILGAPPG